MMKRSNGKIQEVMHGGVSSGLDLRHLQPREDSSRKNPMNQTA